MDGETSLESVRIIRRADQRSAFGYAALQKIGLSRAPSAAIGTPSRRPYTQATVGPENEARAEAQIARAQGPAEPFWAFLSEQAAVRVIPSARKDHSGIVAQQEQGLMMAETIQKLEPTSERDQSEARDRSTLQAVSDQAADVAHRVGDKSADAVKRLGEGTTDVARRTAEIATNVGKKIADVGKRTVETVAGATKPTSEAGEETARKSVEQPGQATVVTLRAIAATQEPLAYIGFDQSQRALEIVTRVTDAYRQATERAAEDVHALIDSWLSLGHGLQRWQHAYFDHLQDWTSAVARKRQQLTTSNSPIELAEMQRDLYVDLMGNSLKASTALLQLAGQIVQEAVQPLQQRARAEARA
jgi:hypothetical protein